MRYKYGVQLKVGSGWEDQVDSFTKAADVAKFLRAKGWSLSSERPAYSTDSLTAVFNREGDNTAPFHAVFGGGEITKSAVGRITRKPLN